MTNLRTIFMEVGFALVALVLLILAAGCSPSFPQEPEDDLRPYGATSGQYVMAKVVESSDGYEPDTVAFLARVFNWDGMSALSYRVESESAIVHSGTIESDQLQIAFRYDPGADIRLYFSAWSVSTDTTRLEWAHSRAGAGEPGQS